jgi:antitoxin PrlF
MQLISRSEDATMKELLMTVTSKGQVTIPAEVRRHLKLRKGQKIALVIERDGEVKLKVPRYPNLASLEGVAGKLSKRLSWDEMREIAYEDAFQDETKHAK